MAQLHQCAEQSIGSPSDLTHFSIPVTKRLFGLLLLRMTA